MLKVGVPLQSPEWGTEAAKGIQTHPGVSAAQPPGVLATLPTPTQALTSARASFLVTSGAPRPHPWSLPGLMPSTHTSELPTDCLLVTSFHIPPWACLVGLL